MIIAIDYHIECNLLRENKKFEKGKKSLIYFLCTHKMDYYF